MLLSLPLSSEHNVAIHATTTVNTAITVFRVEFGPNSSRPALQDYGHDLPLDM